MRPLNICMVGYGMMGDWHSAALERHNVVLHTLVGRRAEAADEFAARYGYRHVKTSLDAALADPEIDAVVLGSPSEHHEDQAIRCLTAGKHTLIEIPIAMSLAGAERVVAAGEASGKTYGVCHPMRHRRERESLIARLKSGEEHVRHIAGRFFIKRLVNIGATGYRRSWIDNILWHHFCHFVDLATFLLANDPIVRVQSHLGPLHPATGTPMECVVLGETANGASVTVHGSYHATFRLYDKLIVTDRETYLFDILGNSLRTETGTVAIETEQINCAHVIDDFLAAIREQRQPLTSGPSVLPAMRILQTVQDAWDALYDAQALPGRDLPIRSPV